MPFNLQGHRGARGLKPENTLPSFEAALDLGVTSIETDVHLSADGVAVLGHDAVISESLCRLAPGSHSPAPATRPLVRSLTLTQLRGYRADRNPDPDRFPGQDSSVTPLARLFAEHMEIDPYTLPTVADLIAFVKAYAGALGASVGKTHEQRAAAGVLQFDLELKRVPGAPETIGDGFDGSTPALLEHRVVEAVQQADVVERSVVRSFDHRAVRAVRILEPRLTTAVLVAETAPIDPVHLTRQAGAQVYCPGLRFLDELQVRQCRDAGIAVWPWTVNEVPDMERLRAWGVAGMTTDYPDRLRVVVGLGGSPAR